MDHTKVDGTKRQILPNSLYMRYVQQSETQREKKVALSLLRLGEVGSYCLLSTEAQFCKMKAVPAMDGDDGFPTFEMSLRAVFYALGHYQDGKCCGMYILKHIHFKNKKAIFVVDSNQPLKETETHMCLQN